MNVAEQAGSLHKARGAGRMRWWIVWTLFFSTVTNYISRQTFSVLAPLITAQYHLTHVDLARVLGAFQISYAVTWLLGGILLDAIGTRLGLALSRYFLVCCQHPHRLRAAPSSASHPFASSWESERDSTGPAPIRPLLIGSRARNAALPWLFSIAVRVSVAPLPHW